MTDFEEAGAKYAYLLQPLKDLEKNFSIDLFSVLDEYNRQLSVLAGEEQFEVENAHRFNFAEAAMLIQGSVSVFGRKVDHIYTQALHFFESLRSTKANPKKKHNDDDDEGIDDGDDDIAEKNTELSITDPCALQDFSRLKSANPATLVMKRNKVKVPTISVMPMSLMPFADFEKCNVPIYAHKNSKDIIGKKDDFRINTGYLGPRCALLLDLRNVSIIDDFATDEFMKIGQRNGVEDKGDVMHYAEPDSGCPSPIGDMDIENMPPGRPSTVECCRRATTENLALLETRDGRPSTILKNVTNNFVPHVEDDDNDPFEDSIFVAPARHPWEVEEPDVDPLLESVMDPYEDVKRRRKPVEMGKRHVLSVPLVEKQKKAEKSLSHRQKTLQTLEYVNEHFYMKSKKQKFHLSNDDWEMDTLFRYIVNQQKIRAAHKKEKLAKKPTRKSTLAVQMEDEDDLFGMAYEDDDVALPATTLPGQSQPEPLRFEDIADEELGNSINIPSLYIGKQPTTNGDGNHLDFDPEPMGDLQRPTSAMSVQEILQFHMNKYWASAAEATSKLAVRVQEWEDKMIPLLEEEEKRKEFDIHEYGSFVLDAFKEVGEVKSIAEICVGKQYYEISRYLLATLMLANTYNVEIVDNQQKGGSEINMMLVKFLKRDRHHDVFDEEGAI